MADKITLGEVQRGDVTLERIFQLNAVLDMQGATHKRDNPPPPTTRR